MGVEIIGFDFGHGESAVCRGLANPEREPTPDPLIMGDGFSGAGPIVTAVARRARDGRVLIGEAALESPDAEDLAVAFKAPNFDEDKVREPTVAFIGRVVEYLVKNAAIADPARAAFVFGAPSGWDEHTIRRFKDVLGESVPYPSVDVVKESRAAFAYAVHSDEIDFDTEHQRKTVLLVDLGSSTIDFTMVDALSERPVDVGMPLGAGLLDKAILAHVLTGEEYEELRPTIESDPSLLAKCEAMCRKAKEAYYTAIDVHGELDYPISVSGRIPTINLFEVLLDETAMATVESLPLPELHGQSWFERLEDELRSIQGRLEASPNIVLLTGGAARMPRVLEVAQLVFGKKRVRRGSEPGLAIARGLVLAGNIDRRISAFRADVARFERTALESVVGSGMKGFGKRLGEVLSKDMTSDFVVPEMERWLTGEVDTLDDVGDNINARIGEFAASPEFKARMAEQTASWFNEITSKVERETAPICERHGLPQRTLTPPHIDVDGDQFRVTDSLDLVGDETLDDVLLSLSAVVAGLVATTAFGAGTAVLVPTGVGTVIVAAVAVFVGLAMGLDNAKEVAQERLRSYKVPVYVRSMLAGKIRKKLGERADEIEKETRKAISKAFVSSPDFSVLRTKVHSAASDAVSAHLRSVGENVAILIS